MRTRLDMSDEGCSFPSKHTRRLFSRMKTGEGWQIQYVRRGRWRVLDCDKFLNITIIVLYELFVFVLELNQVRQSPRDRVFHILVWEP